MKYVKVLGATVVAAAFLLGLAASAPATILTSPTGTVYTGQFTAISHSPVTKIEGSFVTVECKNSHIDGTVTQHGSAKTVLIKLSTKSASECNYPVTVTKPGTLELHATGSGSYRTGTLTSSGTEFSIATSIGTCVFTSNGTHLGTITPTNETGGHATIHINSAPIPRTGGNFLCGPSGTVSGSYTVTVPSTLWINA